MPAVGPAPSEKRRRNNKDTYADVQATVTDDGEVRGPELRGTWSAEVKAWYETWRRCPQAATFISTDWQRLSLVALLVEEYFGGPSHYKLAEIRENETLLGATHVDRLRARIKVERELEAIPPGVAAIDEYRQRLSG